MTQQAKITLQFIDPAKIGPSGKMGPASVKDVTGVRWKVWTTGKNPIPLETFREGGTYLVGYKTEQYNGKDQYTITAAQDVTGGQLVAPAPSIAPPPVRPNGHAITPPPPSAKDKDIWVQAFGKVYAETTPLNQLEGLIVYLQAVYDRTHGLAQAKKPAPPAQAEDDMSDEIPF